MKVLIIGGTGYIGRHLAERLSNNDIDYKCISRHARNSERKKILIADTRDKTSLISAMTDTDVIINCVAGDFDSIADGSKCLVDAALECGKPLIIHMSSMAVYGRFEGVARETNLFDPSLGWYAQAKCIAETQIKRYCEQGGRAVIFRPGCVYGKNSHLWVNRISSWLKSGRIGDLGVAGDGWSNLVYVDDVVSAMTASLQLDIGIGAMEVFNLAAPDSPRWNDYFIDLALTIGATPIRRISQNQLLFDSYLYSPPAKLIELFFRKMNTNYFSNLNPLPPLLVRGFKQQIKLDSTRAERQLDQHWIPYHAGLKQSLQG